MSMNVCPHDIFWTAEHLVTKLGIVMQHHEPGCHAWGKLFAIFQIWSKYDSFYSICWTVDSLAIKHGLIIHRRKLECLVKKNGLLHSRSRSQWRAKMSVFVQVISSKPPNILLPNLVLWCIIMSQSVMQKRSVRYFQGQVHNKGSYDQTMTVSTIFSALLIVLLPNLVW